MKIYPLFFQAGKILGITLLKMSYPLFRQGRLALRANFWLSSVVSGREGFFGIYMLKKKKVYPLLIREVFVCLCGTEETYKWSEGMLG